MVQIRALIGLIVLMCYLPGSSHVLLQCAGFIHQDHPSHRGDSGGSHEHDTDNHEAADGKCVLASLQVTVPQPGAATMPLLFCIITLDLASDPHIELRPSGLAPPGTAPPQLLRRWQFSLRTALQARAPSLIS